MERLISLLEYVKRFDKPTGFYADQLDYYEGQSNAMNYVISYANFLSKKLSLEMFVPCKLVDGVWVAMEEPKTEYEPVAFWNAGEIDEKHNELYSEYQEAKSKCLFEGFKLSAGKEVVIYKNESDDLIIRMHKEYKICSVNGKQVVKVEELIKYNLELTPTAKQQIGL